MKKVTIISTLIIGAIVSSGNAQADASKEENIGFFSGALSGAAVGGPVGFIIGGVSGALLGKEVKKANQLDDVKDDLSKINSDYQTAKQTIAQLQEELQTEIDGNKTAASNNWMTEGLTVNFMFTTGSDKLSEIDIAMIGRLSKVLNQFPSLNLKLDGYADARGTKVDNQLLSEARTEAVKQAFTYFGIDDSRITLNAHGEESATLAPENQDQYAMDRRVSLNFYENSDSMAESSNTNGEADEVGQSVAQN